MEVKIIERSDGSGSYPEPALDPTWDDLTKLQWQAGTIEARTGLQIKVYKSPKEKQFWRFNWSEPEYFLVIHGRHHSSSLSGQSFESAWTCLNGVEIGAEAIMQKVGE